MTGAGRAFLETDRPLTYGPPLFSGAPQCRSGGLERREPTMNLFDMMTRDDWLLLGMVIVILAIPSVIKPLSLWLGKRLGLVKADAHDEGIHAMQEVDVPHAGEAADGASPSSPADLAEPADDGSHHEGDSAASHG